ncbi:MAG: hypothetical protein HY764_02985 [Candidatus Portnoybacteria bacterium]|nr:hypothetical protein [Candidatus Portnoybacteria bacterium]
MNELARLFKKANRVLLFAYCCGFAKYLWFRIFHPDYIERVKRKNQNLLQLEQWEKELYNKLGALKMFNEFVDCCLWSDPDFVSLAQCQQAGRNNNQMTEIRQTIKWIRRKYFLYLIFELR